MSRHRQHESGAVAIFSVVFATLLVMIVTVSFLSLMMRDQSQATNADLSEGAYDSAMAGVEDAKRLIVKYVDCKGSSTSECENIKNLFTGAAGTTSCLAIVDAGIAGAGDDREVIVGSIDSSELNQAYTCAKITMNTSDYLGTLSAASNGGTLIPLKGKTSFDRVRISWYSQADRGGASVTLGSGAVDPLPLLTQGDWGRSRPSVLRASVIRPGGSIELDKFNTSAGSATAFLYPAEVGLTAPFAISSHDARDLNESPIAVSKQGPKAVSCSETLQPLQTYFCQVTLSLGGSTNNIYLALGAIYNTSNYRVELLDGSKPVLFDEVQPSVDATGRASNIFRRVDARVELRSSAVYPDAAVSTVGDLCKDFMITDTASDFSNRCDW